MTLVLGLAIFVTVIFTQVWEPGGGNGVSGEPGTLAEHQDGWFLNSLDDTVLVDVDRIIDGDTLDVFAAGRERLRVRLFGIDAPERDTRCYDEARLALEVSAGSSVRLLADDRLEDANGRQLRYVFTPDGRSIDAALVSNGLAEAWRADGAFRDMLAAIEGEARENGHGCLWSGREN